MHMDPDQLRSLVQDCIAKHLYSTAVFYADKLVTLTQYAPGDVYLVAQVIHAGSAATWLAAANKHDTAQHRYSYSML
jgi:hypothetical protein